MQIFWLLVVYPTSITLWKFDFLFIDVVVWNLSISTRSFLIFALHLLFSFQGAKPLSRLFCSFQNRFRKKVFVSLLLKSALRRFWWAQVDSNHRPHAYQACALTGWAMGPPFGGDEGNRTPDPLLAKQVLSQLSYTPIWGCWLFLFQDTLPGTFKIEQCNCVCSHWAFLKAELEIWASHVSMLLRSP